jgi:hypothetical protein
MKGRLIHPVITSALVVVIVMLYSQVLELQKRITLLQSRNVAEEKDKSPLEIVVKQPRIRAEAPKPAFRLLGTATDADIFDAQEKKIQKGMKADELELHQRRIEFLNRVNYSFAPEDSPPMAPPWAQND